MDGPELRLYRKNPIRRLTKPLSIRVPYHGAFNRKRFPEALRDSAPASLYRAFGKRNVQVFFKYRANRFLQDYGTTWKHWTAVGGGS